MQNFTVSGIEAPQEVQFRPVVATGGAGAAAMGLPQDVQNFSPWSIWLPQLAQAAMVLFLQARIIEPPYSILLTGDPRSFSRGLWLQMGSARQPRSQSSAAKLKFLGAGVFASSAVVVRLVFEVGGIALRREFYLDLVTDAAVLASQILHPFSQLCSCEPVFRCLQFLEEEIDPVGS